jgi:hypothetical protein
MPGWAPRSGHRLLGLAAAALLVGCAWLLPAAPGLAAVQAPTASAAAASAAQRGPELTPIEIPAELVARALALAGAPAESALALRIGVPELRRQLVYQFGSAVLDSRKVDVFIEQEKNKQLASGADPKRFEVLEEQVQKKVEEALKSVREQYPTLDPAVVLSHNNIDIKNLGRLTRQSTMFDAVFLPDNPAEWPATSMEAIKSRMGEAIVQQLTDSYAKRQEELAKLPEEERAKAMQNQGVFQMLMRAQIQQELNAAADLKWASSGLPPEVAMRVNGLDILVDDVYAEIAENLSPQQIDEARDWLVKCALIETALQRSGKLLSEEEFAPLYEAHVHPPEQSFFPMESVVRQFMKFPSMDVYRQYYRLLSSFERLIADQITDASLQAHYEARANRMLNLSTVDCEIILCAAFDFESNRWKEDGWKLAEEEALQVVDQLAAAEGGNWDRLLEAYSDFWDPPAPTQATMQQAPRKKNKGRIGAHNRNELLQTLSESDYRNFIVGSSITDEIFFNLEAGQVGGPYEGPFGYYIVRVLSQGAPTGARSLGDASFRDMVRQDYVATRFMGYGRQLSEAVEPQ